MNRSPDGPNDARDPAGTPGRDASGSTGGRSGEEGLGGLAVAGLGVQFAVSLVVFYFLGQWLDRRLGTAPVFLLGCVFVGGGASFYAMYTQLMRAQRRADAARQARSEGGTGSRRPDDR
jgi:F0F1-type ATP synthase assembly protein I